MTSNKIKPQFVQNGTEKMRPMRQIINAMNAFGTFLHVLRSLSTVLVASTIENAESTPSKKSVMPRRNAHKFDNGIMSTAVGYAMKANPTELVFD